MRDLIQRAASGELHELMNMTLESESVTDTQADLLNNIINELKKRGEIIDLPEDEVTAQYEATLRLHKSRTSAAADKPEISSAPEWQSTLSAGIKINPSMGRTAAEIPAEEEHPLLKHIPQILEDARRDRAEQRQRRMALLRLPIAAASMIMILLLSNAVALAAGYDFLGSISRWTKDAFYFVTGNEIGSEPEKNITQEYAELNAHLAERSISVDLPTLMPDKFYFDVIDPEQVENSDFVVAWFTDGTVYFSIMVKWIGALDEASFFEANSADDMEPYSSKRGNYLITSNLERNKAIWIQNGYELQIQGSISYDWIIQMLNSIGK